MPVCKIQTAAVIGAGVMGAGIAAQLADAGLQVMLLDLDEARAKQGIERQSQTGGFMDPAAIARVHTGSSLTELALVAEADWIIEAAAERLEVKRTLFCAIDEVRKPSSIISSNTSTIRLSALTAGMGSQFAHDFLITHFFNPPRWMRLLEVVTGPGTSAAALQLICDFADRCLGKAIVVAKDTPAFIANRIGNFWMASALHEAIAGRLDIEDADAIIGRPFGMPSGIFAFLDLVGIDLIPSAWASLAAALPAADSLQRYMEPPALVRRLVEAGRTGRKSGAGFSRRTAGGQEVIDLATGEYRKARPANPAGLDAGPAGLRAIIELDSDCGRFADSVVCGTLAYAASLVPDVAESPELADRAMRCGYGWKLGPFELIDKLGAAWLADRLQQTERPVPPLLAATARAGTFYSAAGGRLLCRGLAGLHPIERPEGILTLDDLDRGKPAVLREASIALWDLGDGIGCLELRGGRQGSLEVQQILSALDRTAAIFEGLVITSRNPAFSGETDLSELLRFAETAARPAVLQAAAWGHRLHNAIRYSPIPVVAAVTGNAVGTGCELILACAAIGIHGNAVIGLSQARAGLIPFGGGCADWLAQAGPDATVDFVAEIFDWLRLAVVAPSAFVAREMRLLRPEHTIVMNPDRVLASAKRCAQDLCRHYRPPAPRMVMAHGAGLRSILRGKHGEMAEKTALAICDWHVHEALAGVLSGGPNINGPTAVPEQAIQELEREALVDLLMVPEIRRRIEHENDRLRVRR